MHRPFNQNKRGAEMITLLFVFCFLILANIWYAVTGNCWTIKRDLAERIECFGFAEALVEITALLIMGSI